MSLIHEALRKGADVQQLFEMTHIKPWFIHQMKELVQLEEIAGDRGNEVGQRRAEILEWPGELGGAAAIDRACHCTGEGGGGDVWGGCGVGRGAQPARPGLPQQIGRHWVRGALGHPPMLSRSPCTGRHWPAR